MYEDIDDIQDPRYHMSRRTLFLTCTLAVGHYFYPVRGFAWAWMALRARNYSPWGLATLNPQSNLAP